jgi:hypothetical protein
MILFKIVIFSWISWDTEVTLFSLRLSKKTDEWESLIQTPTVICDYNKKWVGWMLQINTHQGHKKLTEIMAFLVWYSNKKWYCRAWLIDWLKLVNAVEWEWLQKRQSNENLKKTIHSIDYVRSKTTGECLFSLITSDAICICDIISGITMVKVAFNKKKILHHQIGRKCKEETNEMLHLEHSYVWCWNLYTLEVEQKHLDIF